MFLTQFLFITALFCIFWVNGQIEYTEEDNGAYIVVTASQDITWEQALSYCESSVGTTLGSIDDAEQEALLPQLPVYVGATDIFEEGVFRWLDGTPFDYFVLGENFVRISTGELYDCTGWQGVLVEILCSGEAYVPWFVCNLRM